MRILPLLGLSVLLFSTCGKNPKYGSNGETIFMTGKNIHGKLIVADIDREPLQDKNLVLRCAGCHGEDRKGGKNLIPEFGPYTAPDITAASLGSGTDRREAYTETSLGRAIVEGRSPSGRRLHYPMPQWRMSDSDLADLLEYLLRP